MHYSLAIALRYLRARRRSGFVSRVTMIAVGGTLVGVAVLIIVLSLMNGFESELRSRIIEFNTHVIVFASLPSSWAGIDTITAIVEDVEGVVGASPFIRGETLLFYELIPGMRVKTKGVIVKGVDLQAERNVSAVVDSFVPPIVSFESTGFEDEKDLPGIVLGEDLGDDLKVYLGEIITLVSAPAEMKMGEVDPRTREFRVLGFFNTGVFEFDSRFAYIDIKEAEDFFDFEATTRGIGVRTSNIWEAAETESRIDRRLEKSGAFGMNNWIRMNRNLFSYIKVEKILMFLLLTLIILIAAFNLVGMLTMVIMEKRSEIGILRSMGASSRGIMSIFMMEGTIIGALGTALGVGVGLGVCALLSAVELDLPADVYFINTLPVMVRSMDILLVSTAALLISFAATLYPSWEACNMSPLDVIRYD
jgi:lipoprotein-releasing system permease protein